MIVGAITDMKMILKAYSSSNVYYKERQGDRKNISMH